MVDRSNPTFFKGMFKTDRAAIWLEFMGTVNEVHNRWAVNVEVWNEEGPKNALYNNLTLTQAKGLKADIIALWS